jgi:hypothetical protein
MAAMYRGTDVWVGQVATLRPQVTQRSASALACSTLYRNDRTLATASGNGQPALPWL